MQEENDTQNERLDEQQALMEKLNKMIDVLNENLSKEIHTAVRKVAKQMEATTAKRKQPIKQTFGMPSI